MRRARFFPLPGGSGRPLTCSVDSQKLSADRSRVCCCCWCVSRVCPCVFVYPKSRIFFFSSRTMACGRRAKPSWRLISGRRYHAHTEGSPYCFFFWSHVTWSVHTCRRRWPTPQLKKKIEKKAPENNSTPCRCLSSPPALGAQRHAHSHLDKEVHFPCFNFKIIRDIRFTYRTFSACQRAPMLQIVEKKWHGRNKTLAS